MVRGIQPWSSGVAQKRRPLAPRASNPLAPEAPIQKRFTDPSSDCQAHPRALPSAYGAIGPTISRNRTSRAVGNRSWTICMTCCANCWVLGDGTVGRPERNSLISTTMRC
jgi:hypothetical protein